jgi:hypothetical protein
MCVTHAVMPTYFLRYCCLVFWAAVPTSISWATFIIAIITIIAGAAIWLVLAFGIIIDASVLVAMLRSPEFFAILVGLVVLIRLFFAQYWVWKAEREARIKAKEAVNNRENRKNIKVTLGRLIPEAESLMARCRDTTIIPPHDEANTWAQQVEAFLLNNLDESYIPRFRSGSNVMPFLPAGMSSLDHSNLYRGLQIRTARLNEFIKELSI